MWIIRIAQKAAEFAQTMNITYPMALDTAGTVFHTFAKQGAGVTRNVVIDQRGRIAMLTRLFNQAEFDKMKAVIAEELEQ